MNKSIITKINKIVVASLALLVLNPIIPTDINFTNTVVLAKNYKHRKHNKKYSKKNCVKTNFSNKVTWLTNAPAYAANWYEAESNYNVPKIKKFTPNIQEKYHLMGNRWNRVDLTYDDSALPANQQILTEAAISQINNLNILHLTKNTKDANIVIVDKSLNSYLGQAVVTKTHYPLYKGLNYIYSSLVQIDNNLINKYSVGNYNNYFKSVVVHELGHSFGLDHDAERSTSTMSTVGEQFTGTYKIDRDFIIRLALLYQN